MSSIPKPEILLVCRNKLVACMIRPRAAFPQLGEAESIEGRAVGKESGVMVDGLRGYFDVDAWRNILAIGEGEAFEDFAVEGCGAWGVEACGLFHEAVELDHLLETACGDGAAVFG